jgi:hypothetical protein
MCFNKSVSKYDHAVHRTEKKLSMDNRIKNYDSGILHKIKIN